VIATAALTLLAWLWGGAEAALSAALGGAVSVCAGGMSALVAAAGKKSAGGVLIAALLAEGVKIGLIVVLLWTVLVMVDDLVMPAFFGSFFATILLFSMAFFVREYK
jgi:F0F1-type ATP synthase assembly protein I